MTPIERFFAPCPRGLEAILVGELRELGAGNVDPADGGVGFEGPYPLCYAVNLESRIASRVLWRVGHSPYRNEDDIYRVAHSLAWHRWFRPRQSIRVDVSAIRSPLRSLNFATLRIKDAVCDAFRRKGGARPDVDTRNPEVRIHAFLTPDEATLYLDTSGEPLFMRGYRAAAGDAPLRENLAAGILRLSGWSPGTPLVDPMCGSGTFLTEAAMIAADIAPGANRRFGFENLKNFDRKTWTGLRDRRGTPRSPTIGARIYGSDRDPRAVKQARINLARIGMKETVELQQRDVLDRTAPAGSGIIVTNPPYGIRIDERERLDEFYPRLGDALKKNFSGWTAYIFTADMRLPKRIRLSAARRTPLYNGALDCRLFEYRIVAGSNRTVRNAAGNR